MKSLERRFKNISVKNSGWSSFISFAEAVRGQGFARKSIQFWFNELVDENDYNKKDKKLLLSQLLSLSERSRKA